MFYKCITVLRLIDFKGARVNPVLMKTTLPKEDLNSYRPISNLSFISIVLERLELIVSCLTSRQMTPMCRSLRTNKLHRNGSFKST